MSVNRVSRSIYILFLFSLISSWSWGQDAGVGAFIIVSKEGDVQVLDAAGKVLPEEESAAGKTLIEGQTIKTGKNSKMIILLSNGSLTTLEEDSELILEKFRQKPFVQDPNQKIKDLPNEPSNSETKLQLSSGGLMFNVKKLNPGSTFEIESPIGLAGIRGTTGKTEARQDPNTGNFKGGVDMLEGNIEFKVGDQTYDVGGGNGVQSEVTNNGEVVNTQEGPVNQETTQKLSDQKQESEDSSEDVTMEDVSNANKEAEKKADEAPKKEETEEKKEEEKKEEPKEEKKEDEPKEEPKDEPKEETNKETSDKKTEETNKTETEKKTDSNSTQTNKNSDDSKDQLLETDDRADQAQDGIITESKEEAKALATSSLTAAEKKVRVELLAPVGTDYPAVKDLLVKNMDKVKNIETFRYIKYLDEQTLQSITSSSDVVQIEELVKNTVLDIFTTETLSTLGTYSTQTARSLVNDFDPEITLELLEYGYSELEMSEAINGLLNPPVETPTVTPPDTDTTHNEQTKEILAELETTLSENGNEDLLDDLLELGGDQLDTNLKQLAEETNFILSDTYASSTLDSNRIFSFDELKENPFYQEPLFLFESLMDDSNLSQVQTYASRSLILNAALDLSNIYANTQESQFAITTQNSLSISGNVNISTGNVTAAKLAMVSADTVNFALDSTLFFEGDDLLVGSWGNMEVVNVSMESGKSLSLHTLDSLKVQNSDLIVRGGDSISLHAAQEMQLNNVNFSESVKSIYMQAITIDLQNINFPGGSMVDLRTSHGGIDGKYPTFPGDQRQVGRVNFIDNVRYNQNLLNNRTQFDLHGQNILISPINP